MNTFLVIVIIILAVLVVVSMVRGIVAFMQTTKIDLQSGDATNLVELQERQNKMMFNRIKYQALAIVVVALLLLFNR
jgi:hypothetical protein